MWIEIFFLFIKKAIHYFKLYSYKLIDIVQMIDPSDCFILPFNSSVTNIQKKCKRKYYF